MKSANHNANQANVGGAEAGTSAGISQIALVSEWCEKFQSVIQNPIIFRVFNGHRNVDNVNLLLLVAP